MSKDTVRIREEKCQEILRLSVAQYFQSALEVILICSIGKMGPRPEKPVIMLRAAHGLCQQHYNLAYDLHSCGEIFLGNPPPYCIFLMRTSHLYHPEVRMPSGWSYLRSHSFRV